MLVPCDNRLAATLLLLQLLDRPRSRAGFLLELRDIGRASDRSGLLLTQPIVVLLDDVSLTGLQPRRPFP